MMTGSVAPLFLRYSEPPYVNVWTTKTRNLADVSTRCSGLLQSESGSAAIKWIALVLTSTFALKKTRASGQNVSKVSNPVTIKPVTRELSISPLSVLLKADVMLV